MTKQPFGNSEQFKLYKMYKSAKCHTKGQFVTHTLHLNATYVKTITFSV
jgi:hypothetical protein